MRNEATLKVPLLHPPAQHTHPWESMVISSADILWINLSAVYLFISGGNAVRLKNNIKQTNKTHSSISLTCFWMFTYRRMSLNQYQDRITQITSLMVPIRGIIFALEQTMGLIDCKLSVTVRRPMQTWSKSVAARLVYLMASCRWIQIVPREIISAFPKR